MTLSPVSGWTPNHKWIRGQWVIPAPSDMLFGVLTPNGMNFHRSVKNPNSRLIQTLVYIQDKQRTQLITRVDILRDVFGVTGRNRGHSSVFFAALIQSGFVRMFRNGRQRCYRLSGRSSQILKNLHVGL